MLAGAFGDFVWNRRSMRVVVRDTLCHTQNMTRIGIRELRQHTSRYLQLVKAGETIEVTERGKLVALLVAPAPVLASRDRLIASGHLIPAKDPLQLPMHWHVSPTTDSASQELNALREDRHA